MKNKTVLLGMSGGVDSSVAALLLKKKGYNVIGCFMKNFSDTKNKFTGECAWVEERKMAQKIASLLSIPLITLDAEDEYKGEVISPMFKAYASGKTPNPDISCNALIKFPLLWKEARKHNADHIATGHYARIKKINNNYELLAGKDRQKDQSYFLSDLSQDDLSHTLFPLGNMTKKKVREIARKNNFPNWDKQGTRGICFVGKTDMRSFLKQKIPEKHGKILSPEGKFIGTHPGTSYFTIGQKLGDHLGIILNKPKEHSQKRFYIAEKRKGNILVAAPENHPILKKSRIQLKKLHIINIKEKIPKDLKARIRHLGQLYPGKLARSKNAVSFILKKPIESIAPGQYLVLYSKDKVIASAEIKNAL